MPHRTLLPAPHLAAILLFAALTGQPTLAQTTAQPRPQAQTQAQTTAQPQAQAQAQAQTQAQTTTQTAPLAVLEAARTPAPFHLDVTSACTSASQPAEPGFSSSASPGAGPAATSQGIAHDSVRRSVNRPFRSIALAAKSGVNGIGFDLATPVASFLNLRGGAQFFSHDLNPNANGIHSFGQLTLQNVQASLDIFPFRRFSFHLSPGLTLHNDNHLFTSVFVPAGAFFTLGDNSYMSDPNSPINGFARVRFGKQVAPRFTLGWGNMLPREGSHFSVPFEVGFQYISSPTLSLTLYGNTCDGMGNCGDVNSTDGPTNIQAEINQLNQDISTLRFYPIMSIGFSYKFGH